MRNGFKFFTLLIAIPIFVIAGVVSRVRRGKELSKAEWNDIFEKAMGVAVIVIILIFVFLVYFNNRPW